MKISYNKNTFLGGMNLQDEATKLQPGEYHALMNGRIRNDVVRPVKGPLAITNLYPAGNVQGIYGANNFLVVFVNGKAFYTDYSQASPTVTQVSGFLMDTTVDRLFAELVPGSSINFKRQLVDEDQKNGNVNLSSVINGSPAALVVQDGINQAQLILADGTSRVTQTYAQWTDTVGGREYVPLGTLMLFSNAILYTVSKPLNPLPTDSARILLRSVSGRPIDYMVNVTEDGNKSDPSDENIGGAYSVSHSVDFDPITAIKNISTLDNSFYLSTSKNSYLIVPVLEPTIFAEPTFRNVTLFPTGTLNNFSILDINGDTAFIDTTGIRSFNSVLQFRNEGRVSPFSANISPLFELSNQASPIVQDVTCAMEFDNYAFFGIKSKFGYGIAVYDTIRKIWVSFDQYEGVGAVKQFAFVKTALYRKLFFITEDDQIYEWGAGSTESCQFYPQEWADPDPGVQQKTLRLFLSFDKIYEAGTCTVKAYIDRLLTATQTLPLEVNSVAEAYPVDFPFDPSTDGEVQPLSFDFSLNNLLGTKVSFLISWDCDATLDSIQVVADVEKPEATIKQDAIAN